MLSELRGQQAANGFKAARNLRGNAFMLAWRLQRRWMARRFARQARLMAREAGKYTPRSVVHNGGKRRK